MKKPHRVLGLLASLMLFVGASNAMASSYLFQIDDASEAATIHTYQDGTLTSTSYLLAEAYDFVAYYCVACFSTSSYAANIYEVGSNILSDTISITSDSDNIYVAFYSDDVRYPLIALETSLNITETGDWQTFSTIYDANENEYKFQFRSDVEITPIPGAVWIFGTVLVGVAGVGKWRRKRKVAALAA
jgi:hypothetical protein